MQEAGKEASLDDLRAELADLMTEEARLSASRRHLQHQIDFGFESATSREREREVSDERREIHRRIDSVRELIRSQQNL
jgi:regulator of replication initiation timing